MESAGCETKPTMRDYTIGGVKITFPYRPYPSQISLMDKIVRALNRRENCLLESPTGTGKTLTLLCASLAWQKKFREKLSEEDESLKDAVASNSVVDVLQSSEFFSPAVSSQQNEDIGNEPVLDWREFRKFVPKSEDLRSLRKSIGESLEFDDRKMSFGNVLDGTCETGQNSPSSPSIFEGSDSYTKPCPSTNASVPNDSGACQGGGSPLFTTVFSAVSGSSSLCTPNVSHTKIVKNSSSPNSSRFWRRGSFAKQGADDSNLKMLQNEINCESEPPSMEKQTSLPESPFSDFVQKFPSEDAGVKRWLSSVIDDDLDDFKLPKKQKPVDAGITDVVRNDKETFSANSNAHDLSASTPEHVEQIKSVCSSPRVSKSGTPLPKKTPKIFFGSRTHKQITQVIRELRKTPYKDVKMTILSSRDRTCVHKTVSKMENKKEGCDDLVNTVGGPSCVYYRNYRKLSRCSLPCLSRAWDLEDLVKELKRISACPYFSARALVQDSDIVFCPYNYLIDPIIRSSLDISLTDNIVIMDEAHNIEDCARDAASFSVRDFELSDAIADLHQVQFNEKPPYYQTAVKIFTALRSWLIAHEPILAECSSFDLGSKVYSDNDMLAVLANAGISASNFHKVKKCFEAIYKYESDSEDDVKLTAATTHLIRALSVISGYIFRGDSCFFAKDYRCVVLRKKNQPFALRKNYNRPTWELSMNFWCLNPAVAFTDLKGSIYNLIVASGTLSPMKSFESEIDMPFQIRFEAAHVVSLDQLWIGTVSQGPMGSALNGTFRNIETFSFQDEIGSLLLEMCSVIPHGVLCFVPSYNVLQKLSMRWQSTGLWDQLLTKKKIVCEPKGANENFDAVMKEFYDAVDQDDDNGALLIAVCRGKVSEGLDFSDNYARAVISVGIPFPNVKDMQVDLKKKHNNMLCSQSNVMSGNEWYEAQAFRALNQALGRCIRHRDDFGALILVDERFQKNTRYSSSLSKWIKKELVHFRTFTEALSSLKVFFDKKTV